MHKNEQNPPQDDEPVTNPEEPPAETLPSHCSVYIRDWENDNKAEARDFGQIVMSLAKECSRYLDLSRLGSIIIGWDYAEALASVDRGDSIPPRSANGKRIWAG